MTTEKATTNPKLEKNRPTIPPMKATGRKITTSERLVARTASAISLVPTRAASIASIPSSSMWRKMFSWTTTASSITIPIARISASIVILLSVNPMYCMNRNVGMIDVGIARVAMTVVRQSRMNRRIVAETSPAASRRWNFTSSIDFRTNRDWSLSDHDLDVGREGRRTSSSRAFRSSTTLTVFTPDCFWIDQADGVLAVEPGLGPGLLEGVDRPADVLDPDRGSPLVGDDQVVELPGGVQPAEGPEDHFARTLVDPPARLFEVLAFERGLHVVDRQGVGRELVGVDGHVDRPGPAADEVDRADAGDGLQPLLDLPLRQLRDLAEIPTARDGQRQDRHPVGVELVDDRRLGPLGQVVRIELTLSRTS